MKRFFLFALGGFSVLLFTLLAGSGGGQSHEQASGLTHYSMEYTLERRVDGILFLDFLNIQGFDDICLEYVSEDKESAQIFSKMSLAPGPETDRSEPPRMSVILPVANNADPRVVLRFRRGGDGPVVFYIKFIPSTVPLRGKLYLGNDQDESVVTSIPRCPPGCWLAQIVQLIPPVCVNDKCCNNGGVTYDLTTCTITCHNGDCD